MQIKTDNYTLRTLTIEDATECYLSWLKDKDINRTLDVDGQGQTLDTIRQYICKHDNKTSFLFGIFTKDGDHIGTHSFNFDPKNKLATVGVMIGDKSYWGKAVPLETRARIMDWAFDDLGCNKIEAGCYSINMPAIYNFKRQHWGMEGILRQNRVVDKEFIDVVLFGMTKKEWYEQR
jgi:[ribosomal protein S5]-alanine N-acetyltransferase